MSVESAEPKPALPLVVAIYDDRGWAWVRFVLLAILLGLLLGVPTLVAAEWFSEPPAPWRAQACLNLLGLGVTAALLAGSFWIIVLPWRWTITEDAIFQVGPTRRRRVLRWDEVQRVGRNSNGLYLHGPRGSATIRVRLTQIQGREGPAVRAAIEERLSHYFTFSEPPPWSGKQRARLFLGALLTFVPGMAGLILIGRALRPGGQPTRLPWLRWALQQGWVRRWGRRYRPLTGMLLLLWIFAPPLLWIILIGRLVMRGLPQRALIVRKTPGSAAPDESSRLASDS